MLYLYIIGGLAFVIETISIAVWCDNRQMAIRMTEQIAEKGRINTRWSEILIICQRALTGNSEAIAAIQDKELLAWLKERNSPRDYYTWTGRRENIYSIPILISKAQTAAQQWQEVTKEASLEPKLEALDALKKAIGRLSELATNFMEPSEADAAVKQAVNVRVSDCETLLTDAYQAEFERRLSEANNGSPEDLSAQVQQLCSFVTDTTGYRSITDWNGSACIRVSYKPTFTLQLPGDFSRRNWNELVARAAETPHCSDFLWGNREYPPAELLVLAGKALESQDITYAKMLLARCHADDSTRRTIGENHYSLLALMVDTPSLDLTTMVRRQLGGSTD